MGAVEVANAAPKAGPEIEPALVEGVEILTDNGEQELEMDATACFPNVLAFLATMDQYMTCSV